MNETEDEQYFLGSIVLVKEDDKPHAEVIDGQQRLTTVRTQNKGEQHGYCQPF